MSSANQRYERSEATSSEARAVPPSGALDPGIGIGRLLAIMASLRTPGTGCPWDLEQTFATIAPYTIEEAYEVADAIERNDLDALKDELGDLLLQVVFHARMAEEAGAFDFHAVAEAISAKMIRRHPHVFGSAGAETPGAVKRQWEDIKAEERRAAVDPAQGPPSVLDGVPKAVPALMRAEKVQKRAARVGFDWRNADEVMAKIEEELLEVRAAKTAMERTEEIGDLLFAVVNLARHSDIDAETALRDATAKFERRFRGVEGLCRERDLDVSTAGLTTLESLWQETKRAEPRKAP
jgi:ATP diphosphatase